MPILTLGSFWVGKVVQLAKLGVHYWARKEKKANKIQSKFLTFYYYHWRNCESSHFIINTKDIFSTGRTSFEMQFEAKALTKLKKKALKCLCETTEYKS